MLAFTAPTPDSLDAFFGSKRKSHFRLFETPTELADFAAGFTREMAGRLNTGFSGAEAMWTPEKALSVFRDGSIDGVAKSDALLSRFESAELHTSARAWRDDVCGALPNVPAFIAGHPMNMRRREKRENAFAPLAIIVDIGAAASVTAQQIETRGAAVLALVRALSGVRPVELWAGAGLDADGASNASWTFCRIETAPLDLAHAAHILTHTSAIRRVLWGAACAHGFGGRTPYGSGQKHATEERTRALIMPAFGHVSDVLVLPRLSEGDEGSIKNPAAWIEAQIAAYAPQDAA